MLVVDGQLDGAKYVASYWCGHNMDVTRQSVIEGTLFINTVEASGDELEAIRRYVTGVKMVPGRIVIWTGEDAEFIVMNLDLMKVSASEMKRVR